MYRVIIVADSDDLLAVESMTHQAEYAILALQVQADVRRHVVTGEHGHTDTEVSVHVIFKFERCPLHYPLPHPLRLRLLAM